jgi:predicted acetyltransferase
VAVAVEVRAAAPEELEDFVRAEAPAWGHPIYEFQVQLARQFFEPERTLMALDGGVIVGGAAMRSMRLAVPGARLRMAGLTFVYVRPTHRRQGVLTRMLRRHLDEMRGGEESLSTLFASESGIYRRFGYGVAMQLGSLEIERRAAALVDNPGSSGRLELVDKENALMVAPQIYERVAAATNGMFDRSAAHWDLDYASAGEAHGDEGPTQFLLHVGEHGPDGFATYRLQSNWEHNVPDYRLAVQELIALNPAAELDLWRYLLAHDLVAVVAARWRPVEEPLLHRLADPRRLRRQLIDGLHVRPIDIAAALAGRRYACQATVVLRIVDPFCPWNDGVYRLEGGPDGAHCEPTGGPPDLVLDAASLGSTFLGEFSFEVLQRTGRVEEVTLGAVARASAMFAWWPRPWASGVF